MCCVCCVSWFSLGDPTRRARSSFRARGIFSILGGRRFCRRTHIRVEYIRPKMIASVSVRSGAVFHVKSRDISTLFPSSAAHTCVTNDFISSWGAASAMVGLCGNSDLRHTTSHRVQTPPQTIDDGRCARCNTRIEFTCHSPVNSLRWGA